MLLGKENMSTGEVACGADRQHRRLKGKSDQLDAEQAALTVAAGPQ